MNGAWITLGAGVLSFIGGIFGNFIAESYRQKNRLRLAAIDRRLEVHQKAYALCAELCEAIEEYQDPVRVSDAVYRCRDWWPDNCLYLNSETRQAFASVCCNPDPKSEQVINVMNALEREMGFPSSSSAWRKTKS